MSESVIKRTIRMAHRFYNTRDGNPVYGIVCTDGSRLVTAADSAMAYEVTNPEYRGVPVLLVLNQQGKVIGIEADRKAS